MSSYRPGGRLACITFVINALTTVCLGASSADVSLQAAFPRPPFIAELIETAAYENSSSYFPLLDRLAEGHFSGAHTEEDLYKLFLKTLQDDGHISDQESLSSFKLALSVHSAAPRVEAHYQYYNTTARHVGESDCETWLIFDGKRYCTPDPDAASAGSVDSSSAPLLLPFDRVLGDSASAPAILYADITSPEFPKFHRTISATAKTGRTSYRLRHKPAATQERKPLWVSGYGVELALKRTDYIVIDDRKAAESKDGQKAQEQTVLVDDDVADLRPLSSSELMELGLKASSFIMSSEDKFGSLLKLVEDFPKYSSRLSNVEVDKEIRKELAMNAQEFLPPGYNVMWLNGRQLVSRDLDAFSLLEQLRTERSLTTSAKPLGLSGQDVIRLISHPAITESAVNEGGIPHVQRYDWRDDPEKNMAIIWMNNLEKDKRYLDWPDSKQSLLQRMFPGQLPSVRKEINVLVLPVNFSDRTDVQLILESLQGFIVRKIALRIGLVPIARTPVAEQYSSIVLALIDTYGLASALRFLELSLPDLGNNPSPPSVTHFKAAIKDRTPRKNREPLTFETASDSNARRPSLEMAQKYLKRLGATGASPPYFANGAPIVRGDDWMQQMSNRVGMDTRIIQQALYLGQLDYGGYLPDLFLEKALPRRNALIIPEDEKNTRLLNLDKLSDLKPGSLGDIPSIPASSETVESNLAQLILFADFDLELGARLFKDALQLRKEHDNIELFLVQSRPPRRGGLSEQLYGIIAGKSPSVEALEEIDFKSPDLQHHEEATGPALTLWQSAGQLRDQLSLAPEAAAIVLNGRVVGPIQGEDTLDLEDLEMLLSYETKSRLSPVTKALKSLGLDSRASNPYGFARLSNLVALSQKSDAPEGIFESSPPARMWPHDKLKGEHTSIVVGDSSTSSIHLVVAVDPASEMAQTWLPVVNVLSQMEGVSVQVFLNPKDVLEEIPVKRFYRHVLSAAPQFDDSGALQEQSAHFAGLPADALLTIGMDLPPAWLVSPKDSVHDLDNLRLSSLATDKVEAVYQLDHILIEGHSRDVSTGAAPRGAQLILSTGRDEPLADTIIMANLGYFQFKANPGFYNLSLQHGRSQEIFNIDSAGIGGQAESAGDAGTDIALTSFRGTTLFPRLSRKPGMEQEDVLEPSKSTLGKAAGSLADDVLNALRIDGSRAGGWLSKATQKVASLSNTVDAKDVSILPHADINIFSVASGHLYERMLNIMMVSVMKHTSHTVKFWFIEQFLSPSFKEFLPFMAEEYGFKYEMVTYKWPHWLRAQKEKQREIWGYKILFLDVLFPLDLDKVIFVDADQIVRTDMYELVQYDLKGAPYGFTPMCDSRTEMEGFRFWKQGYWKSFLRGLPYHISALYVVDLAKFRQLAAGDRLRQQYHQLSADPESLSNLDQDLPNHMQHTIPIHSLPQEWLWCETWCSDASLGVAKTIDLCNNPQTKEPKLARAKRQVPEWTVYDEEISNLAKRERGEAAVGEGKGEQERLQAEEYQRKVEEEKQKQQEKQGERGAAKDEL